MIKRIQINQENLTAHEVIGQKVRVKRKGSKEIKGKLVNETMHTFLLEQKNNEKIIPKKESVLIFSINGKKTVIDGKNFVGKPEDRIKLFWRKQHGKK